MLKDDLEFFFTREQKGNWFCYKWKFQPRVPFARTVHLRINVMQLTPADVNISAKASHGHYLPATSDTRTQLQLVLSKPFGLDEPNQTPTLTRNALNTTTQQIHQYTNTP